MNDSVDIKTAANRLQSALQKLEGSLGPLVDKVTHLERIAAQSESLETDRASMAKDLDDAKAREAEFSAREAEFAALASDTQKELDAVISHVQQTLARSDAGDA